MTNRSFSLSAVTCLLALVVCSSQCFAHFTWLTVDKAGHALLFFSESPQERNYHLPEGVAEAKVVATNVKGESETLALPAVDEEDYVGRRSKKAKYANAALNTTFQYGIYSGTLLTYYAKYIPAEVGKPSGERPMLDVDIKSAKKGLEVTVYWDGKPLEGAGISLSAGEEEPAKAKTDENGKAEFEKVKEGMLGLIVGHVVKEASGKLDGESYGSESHYCTVTYQHQKETKVPAVEVKSALPELPEGMASFGAAVCGDWLYTYGGHTGTAHDHSCENLCQHFQRTTVDGKGEWENLTMQTPLQGLPLVAHGDKLYRVGGLSARNKPDEDEDLHSVAEFSRFDPETKRWEELAPLPEPRSSHDAVVIGDKLYVVGGWKLAGSSAGTWLETAWVCDLSQDAPKWEAIPSPPEKRRALALANWNGKLVAIGGMDSDDATSARVECFDPESGKWTELAEFPGGGFMSGFGASAWGMDGTVYASGWGEGQVFKLADDGQSWTEAGKVQLARFFHRLLPAPGNALFVVSGATERGHVTSIEKVEIQ